MDYIFTEVFFESFKIYINIILLIELCIQTILALLSDILPIIVKYLIGYCHFFYQLGYGLIFYIYLYRRHKAKKTKN